MPLNALTKTAIAPPRTKTSNRKQRKTAQKETSRTALRSLHWTHWLLIAVILFCTVLRLRLRDIPLERDEGEYAYAGQLMLHGIPPYQLAYNMKLPGTYAAYAAIEAVFGETSGGIHTGIVFLDIVSALILFLLGRKLTGSFAGTFAAMTFMLLTSSPPLLGTAGHAEKFVVFATLLGLLSLLYAVEKESITLFLLSGTFFGFAFLMKQPGIVFGLFGLAWVVWVTWSRPVDWRRLFSRTGAMVAGMAWPFALACLLLYGAGVFHNFWFWTFAYARTYVARVPFSLGMRILWKQAGDILPFGWALWALVLAGLVVLLWRRYSASQRTFIVGLLLFAFAGVSAGFYFRSHYFVLLLPAAAMLSGLAIDAATDYLRHQRYGHLLFALPAILFLAATAQFFVRGSRLFFAPTPLAACQRLYSNNPFAEAQQIGEFLRAQTPANGRIAVFGSEPEIYFVAQRHSATGYIYTYPLMEDQPYAKKMQDEMMTEIAQSRPEYVVFVDNGLSWLWQEGASREDFFRRIQQLINTQYVKAAQVDIAGTAEHLLPPVPRIYVFRRADL